MKIKMHPRVSFLFIFLALTRVESYFNSLEECENATDVTQIFFSSCVFKLPTVASENTIICKTPNFNIYKLTLNSDGLIGQNGSCLRGKNITCMEVCNVSESFEDLKTIDNGLNGRGRRITNVLSVNLICNHRLVQLYGEDSWLKDKIKIYSAGISTLNLSQCVAFKQLKVEEIPTIPELTHLYLSSCDMTTPGLLKWVNHFPAIKVLDVSRNSYMFVGNQMLTSFQHLRDLDISATNLNFDPKLKINETKIEILRASTLDTRCRGAAIRRLKTFQLRHPECRDWNVNTMIKYFIPQMKSLKYLDLSDNNITNIPQNSFHSVLTNGVVVLRKNKINYTSSLNLSHLSSLDLSYNSITSLDDLNIHGKVDTLNLEFNNVKNWKSSEIFNSVKYLNISYNDIRAVDSSMIKSLSVLEVVDIGNNPFDCDDCSLYEFQQWLQSKKKVQVTNLGRSYTTLQCKLPKEQDGRLLIDVPFNELCDTDDHGLIYGVAIPIPILIIISAILTYIFRFQLVYISHMIRVWNRAKKSRGSARKFLYDAFVSYSSSDRNWVHDVLLDTLENEENKYALCLHERDFRLGGYIMDNVAESIEQSRYVILVLSPNFVSSKWCQWELKLVQQLMFENNPDFLILVELEKLCPKELPSTLRLLMSTRTYLECPRAGLDMSNFWIRLKKVLGDPLGICKPEDDVVDDSDQECENVELGNLA